MSEKTPNEELASGSNDGDHTDAYDAKHGHYEVQKPAVAPSKAHDQIKAPFKLGG